VDLDESTSMIVVGVVMLIVGFALSLPREGGVPGSEAIRHVDLGMGTFVTTPGRQPPKRDRDRSTVVRTMLGVLLVIGGFAVIYLSL
jgi:hypothetical protein